MIFQGRGVQALCEQLRDKDRNGYRNLDDLVQHVAEDHLVSWGWNPGPGRTPVPVPHDVTVAAMKAWRDLGGSCPEDKTPWTGAQPAALSPSDAGVADGGQ